MPTIIATAGAPDANSYATRAEATAYHAAHLYASIWEDADDDQKDIALLWATRVLDEQFDWVGQKIRATQALRWPRLGVTDRDGWAVSPTTIPMFLKNATAELARQLLARDRFATRDEAASGIQSVDAGSVSVTFGKLDRIALVPESVLSIVEWYILGSESDGLNVALVRV